MVCFDKGMCIRTNGAEVSHIFLRESNAVSQWKYVFIGASLPVLATIKHFFTVTSDPIKHFPAVTLYWAFIKKHFSVVTYVRTSERRHEWKINQCRGLSVT